MNPLEIISEDVQYSCHIALNLQLSSYLCRPISRYPNFHVMIMPYEKVLQNTAFQFPHFHAQQASRMQKISRKQSKHH